MNMFRQLAYWGSASLMLGLSACAYAPAKSSASEISAQLVAVQQAPSGGQGTLTGTLDRQTRLLSWHVSYGGLTGPVRAGHFHGPAMPGQNAGVALGLGASMDDPIKGSAILTPEQLADLLAGRWYVNLHTAAYPGGEIRGQVSVAP